MRMAATQATHERTESARFRQTTDAAEARAALEAALEAATEEAEAAAATAASRERDLLALQAQLDTAEHHTGTCTSLHQRGRNEKAEARVEAVRGQREAAERAEGTPPLASPARVVLAEPRRSLLSTQRCMGDASGLLPQFRSRSSNAAVPG
jgi:hypothetical protein